MCVSRRALSYRSGRSSSPGIDCQCFVNLKVTGGPRNLLLAYS